MKRNSIVSVICLNTIWKYPWCRFLSVSSVIISFLPEWLTLSLHEKPHNSVSKLLATCPFHLLQRWVTRAVVTQPDLFGLKTPYEYNLSVWRRSERWADCAPSKTARAELDLFRRNECSASGTRDTNNPHNPQSSSSFQQTYLIIGEAGNRKK